MGTMKNTIHLWLFWSYLIYDPNKETDISSGANVIQVKLKELSLYLKKAIGHQIRIRYYTYDTTLSYEENKERMKECDLGIYIHCNTIPSKSIYSRPNYYKPFIYNRIGRGIYSTKSLFDEKGIPCLTWYCNNYENESFLSNFYVNHSEQTEGEWTNDYADFTIQRRVYPDDLVIWNEEKLLSNLNVHPVPNGFEGPVIPRNQEEDLVYPDEAHSFILDEEYDKDDAIFFNPYGKFNLI